jgi:DNA oxidative demethylase
MTGDLFATLPRDGCETLAENAVLLRGFAGAEAAALLAAVEAITAAAPFRRMMTPGGRMMSVEMTNCGPLGWVTDRAGYRYAARDPLSGAPWSDMPPLFAGLAARAADAAGFPGFAPDACLINRYRPGAQMSPHQDRDERDLGAPIVSVSLGLPATFLFGGARRSDPARRVRLESGDVVVWGGASRLAFHGVARLAEGEHPLAGRCRINLTFRKAG